MPTLHITTAQVDQLTRHLDQQDERDFQGPGGHLAVHRRQVGGITRYYAEWRLPGSGSAPAATSDWRVATPDTQSYDAPDVAALLFLLPHAAFALLVDHFAQGDA